MGLVRGVLRDYFWSECYLHALFAEGEFWFSWSGGHYHRLYHPRWGGDFRLYSDAGWLARAGLSNITAEGWFPHGGLPILMTMVAVNFAFRVPSLSALPPVKRKTRAKLSR